MCQTAPVLCTIDELDNYSFSMTSFQHPNDGPTPLCPPPQGTNTQSNNPTWFAFVAWCTSLTLFVDISNCTAFNPPTNGVQIAIYSGCGPSYPAVACNTSVGSCNTNDKTLVINGLTIGNTYYFLIDGCAGAYCDVSIDVVGTCGAATIQDWTQGIAGPDETCVGNSDEYSVQSLNGATDYHWYLDGVLIAEGNEMIDYTHLWNTPGTYQLCVDASNVPCIPESNPPAPTCIIVEVFESEAGMIQAMPEPLCPGNTVMITTSGFTTGQGYQHYILVVDASGIITVLTTSALLNFTYGECGTFTAYSYTLHSASDANPPQLGAPFSQIGCNDGCCDLEMVEIEFEDSIDPVFINPPPDLDLSCFDIVPAMQPLAWTDNCAGAGNAAGAETGILDMCTGGVLVREWEFTDSCGNTVTHQQMISVDPIPEADFVNPPADITVDCNSIPSSAPSLVVMNSGVGGCAISTIVAPVQNSAPDVCGGAFTYTWQYTDLCGRAIEHVQNITVLPIPAPMFMNIPVNITIECADIPTSAPLLSYSNSGTGNCDISGSVQSVTTGSANLCGGMLQNKWDFTDVCGRMISATQTITVNPVPPAVFINPPLDMTIMCNAIPASIPALDYTNGLSGNCIIAGSVAPVTNNNANACGGTIVSTWQFTDPCGDNLSHTQTITVTPAPLPMWINPPADTIIACTMLPPTIPDLAFTNGEMGVCAIAGSVPGVQTVFDVCQGIVVRQWLYTDLCGNMLTHTQNITTNPPPPVVFTDPPADVTVNCDAVSLVIPSLIYTNNSAGACLISGTVAGSQTGSYTSCGGELMRTWQVTDLCGIIYTHTQTITVNPAPSPVFLSPPVDITMNCSQVPPVPPTLTYSNSLLGACAIIGVVPAAVAGSFNACGGTLTYTWTVMDNCGNGISHSQNVSVLPAPPPVFASFPADMTLSCDQVPALPPTLSFSNGQFGSCAIAGSIPAAVTGTYDACGGAITYLWSFTDLCGNVLTHAQQITVSPAANPLWTDPPADLVLGCDDEYLPPDDLSYTNNLSGICTIDGIVAAAVSFNNNVYTHIWSYNHPCSGATISHVQQVTIVPIPEIAISPDEVFICAGDVFDLSTILVTEVNDQVITVTFHSDSPAEPGNQLSSSLWTAEFDEEFYILATNSFGCTDEVLFEFYVEPLPNAGEDVELDICQTETVNLENLLDSDADSGGEWLDVDGSGADLSNPSSVTFQFVDPGVYDFIYYVSINDCPEDSAVVELTLYGPPDFSIDSVYCTTSNTEYIVVINGTSISVSPSDGNVVTIPGGVMIEHIPIDEQLSFDIYDSDIQCVFTYFVNAPNCNCPSVPAPVSLGDAQVCTGDPNPALSVSVVNGTIATWFNVPVGGVAIAANTTIYMPGETMPGTYTYYVEAESVEFPGCLSSTRTPVTLTIHALPVVNDIELIFCDTLDTGMLNIDLSVYASQINANPVNNITFHSTQNDAESGNNSLPMPIEFSLGTTNVFARVININGCVDVSEVGVTINGLPVFGIDIQHEACFEFGESGRIEITGLSAGYLVEFDGELYTDQFVFNHIDAGTYLIEVTSLVSGCSREVEVEVEDGPTFDISIISIVCNDNGTDTDPTDDYYEIQVVATTTGSNSAYQLVVDGTPSGYYDYGESVSFTFPVVDYALSIVSLDSLHLCAAQVFTGILIPCSSNCNITVDDYAQVCDDNNTPVDPSDDYHVITINASAVNGSASNQYAVYFNGVLTYVFTYGTLETFNLPVSSPAPIIRLEDASDPQCVLNLMLEPLVSCSNQCVIPAPDVQYTCNNNGTPADVTDDIYTIIFIANVTNPGASGTVNILIDGILNQTVLADSEVELLLPADGLTHSIQIVDADQPSCDVQWTTIPLEHCSTLCIIDLTSSSIGCDDNGTPLDPTDDFYVLTWNASAVFGAANMMYQITVDGNIVGGGMYGDVETLTLPADGSPHTLIIIDAEDANCRFQWDLPALVHCSHDCTLTATVIEKYCDNNGTNQTEADDIWYVVVLANGVNIPSGQWSTNGQPVGTLGVQDTLGPFLISDSDQILGFNAVGSNCSHNIQVAPPPACSSCEQTIDAGADAVLDCGMPTAQLTVIASTPGIASWKDPGGGTTQSATINVSIAGQYIATVVFSDGCVFSDTVIVSADPTLPAVWGGPDHDLNCAIREVLLESEVLVGGLSVTYEWTDQAGNVLALTPNLLVSQPGSYFIRIYDPDVDCWSGKDVVEVFDISNQPLAIIYADPGNILSCVIQFIVLNSDKESNVKYTWISQGMAYTDSVFTIYEGGTVTLVALDTISLCESKDSITVEALLEYPFILVDPPLSLTCARTSVILDASGSIPSSGGNFVWTTIAGDTLGANDMLSVQQAGTYVVELNDPANGCVSFDTIEVSDISEFPELIPANDVELPCDSENQNLNASLIVPLPGVTFEWIPRQGGQILGSTDEPLVTVRGPGMYIVIATHAASLCTDSDTILVTEITDKPTAIISQVSDANCEEVADGMIQISDVQGGLEPFTYYIDGIEVTEALITNLSAGTYLLEIEDAHGCVLDTLVTVVNGEEVMVDLEAVVNIEAGENHVLMAGVNISSDEISSVKWIPADHLSCDTCLITQASPEEDITYTVTVTDISGCTGEAMVTIRVINRTSVFVPNIISPNGDNVNDYLTVFTSDAEARVLSMRIFDRWGAVLFEKFTFSPNIPSEGWNGTFNNEPLNPAVFVYMIELELENGFSEILKGDVTIIR